MEEVGVMAEYEGVWHGVDSDGDWVHDPDVLVGVVGYGPAVLLDLGVYEPGVE